MGIRLYPSTTNPENIEKLAAVPAGTAERLNRLIADCKLTTEDKSEVGLTFRDIEDRYEGFYGKLHSKEYAAEASLDHFLTFGFGKFHGAGVIDIHKDDCGRLTDKPSIQAVFDANGIAADVELCEGICWN